MVSCNLLFFYFYLPLILQADFKIFLNAMEYCSGRILNKSGMKNISNMMIYTNKYVGILFVIAIKTENNIDAPMENCKKRFNLFHLMLYFILTVEGFSLLSSHKFV